jgi:transposase
MPRKTDGIKIGDSFLKRSSKLLPCQKEMVVYWSQRGHSTRQLASMFNVSRRLIQFIIDPDKHKANLERRKENGGSYAYYDKDYHSKKTKEHREYKKDLFNKKNIK